jgi:hypothetical protein
VAGAKLAVTNRAGVMRAMNANIVVASPTFA